jgi:hypothetical protein
MKKLLVFFMVLAMAAPAMAADNLSLSGQVRVRSWDTENYTDFNDDGADKEEYFNQRFRLQTEYAANDQVKGVLRMDFAEDNWGSSDWSGARYDESTEVQVDRAYMDITTGPLNIKAGQQWMAVGQSQVYRPNKPGIQLTFTAPVIVELGYMVEQDQDAGAVSDEQNLHLSLEYNTDAFMVQGFYAQQVTTIGTAGTADQEDTKTVMGVNAKTSVGPVQLNTELAIFGGDDDAAGGATDYIGTQFNVDADMKLSDMIKIGADFIYSDGTNKTDEQKIALVSDAFGLLNRSEGGSGNYLFDGDLAPLGGEDVFDPFDQNQGAIGLGVDVVVTPMKDLNIFAHVLYLTAAEDTTGNTGYDTVLVYNLGANYMIAPKAQLALYYNATTPDQESATVADDTASAVYGHLQISF